MNIAIKNKITRLMTGEGLPQLCIDVFLYQYAKIIAGKESFIRENNIQSVANIVDIESLPDTSAAGQKVLNQSVMLKLNGGLGTSMGLEKAKSLLVVKNKLNFLEIIIQQVLKQRQHFNSNLPLVFMNSFNTEADTQSVLAQFPELLLGQKDIPLTFVQNKVPKILVDSKEPVEWSKDPTKAWCPPGHGDIYTALQTSGILNQLLAKGIKYAFISNADNLGASMDLSLLGYFAELDASLMLEVADRTVADRKGGHLALFSDGGLLLRESAQCHADDSECFQDIKKYPYFNSNNLWLRLDRLNQHLKLNHGILNLPLIQNIKTIDPNNSFSHKVIQMETAMGSAITCFKDAVAIRIPKSRFVPVKTTNELLGLWSNAFVLDKNSLVVTNPNRKAGYIAINLDPQYFKTIADLQARFAEGAPDLLACKQLTVVGDVKFGTNIKVIGNVSIKNHSATQRVLVANTVLQG